MTDVQQQTLSMSRVAQILGVSIEDVADATDTGELPHRNINGQIFYLMQDVEQYLEQAARVGRHERRQDARAKGELGVAKRLTTRLLRQRHRASPAGRWLMSDGVCAAGRSDTSDADQHE